MEADKIYWLFGDFKILNPDEPDSWDSVAKIDSSVVDSNMIKFHTEALDFEDGDVSGLTVNLQATKSDFFEGKAIKIETGEEWAKVTCELFENTKRFLLKGTWIEKSDDGEYFFTWILILNKK